MLTFPFFLLLPSLSCNLLTYLLLVRHLLHVRHRHSCPRILCLPLPWHYICTPRFLILRRIDVLQKDVGGDEEDGFIAEVGVVCFIFGYVVIYVFTVVGVKLTLF
jgi:hypothetical protein